MSTRKAIFLEILSGLHAFLMCMGLYPVLATLCGLSGMGFVRFHAVGMLLFIPIFSSRILLRKIRNMIGYLLAGVLVSVFCFYAAFHLGTFFRNGNWVLGILTGALSFFVFCVHTHAKITYGRMKRDFQSMPGGSESFTLREWEVPTVFSTPAMGHWIWFTLLYLCGLFLHSSVSLRVIFYMVLTDVFIYFLYHYQYEFFRYVRENHAVANLPIKTMKRIHKAVGAMAILLLALFMLPAVWYGREPLEKIHFVDKESERQEQFLENSLEEREVEEQVAMAELAEGEPPFVIPEWIRRVAGGVLFLGMAAAVVALLRMLFRAIQNAGTLFAVEEEDEIIFLNTRDENDFSEEEKVKRKWEGWLSVNARIRWKYKKQIQKGVAGRPNAWASPTELERQAGLDTSKDMQVLHAYYEKARYSEEGCTHEEYMWALQKTK